MVCTRNKDYGDPPSPKPRKVIRRPGTEFTLFPKLPCELRLMIWQASMTPRLVAVGPKGRGPKGLRGPRSYHSRKILPALLSVNKDSRYCALRHYTLRFTMTLTVDETGRHRWDCPKFQGTNYIANVVMSSEDTLGFLGWETLNMGHGTRFQVKSAAGKSPWQGFPTNHEAQPQVKKVAYLGRDIAINHGIVHDLNSAVLWDLNSKLHTKCTTVRKLSHPWKVWSNLPEAPSFKDEVLIQSRNFNGSFEDWGKRLIFRAERRALPMWSGAPDILAFELGKKPEVIPRPANFVPARSVQDLYSVLPQSFVWKILDDFYASKEWTWSVQFPDRRGF